MAALAFFLWVNGLEAWGQAGGPGNWEFFASPTRNPTEPRWGTYSNIRRQEREAAAARANYCPTSGCVIRLDQLTLTPRRVLRDRPARLSLTYTILTPDDIGIPVNISREIFYQGVSLGKTSSRNLRTPNGTFEQAVEFTLPPGSKPGTYTVKVLISTGYGQDEKSLEFRVD
ncbi:MAG: hypothetical protein ACUVRZ_02465 [Desulfobacca sp.]|uniref:hypothetical protein n=1 Tax=Desulfobacca sp. TaxID=2067990 RepID=UPI004049AB9D